MIPSNAPQLDRRRLHQYRPAPNLLRSTRSQRIHTMSAPPTSALLGILQHNSPASVLCGLRNLSASRIAVLVDTERATEWQENDFFALALQRRARFSQDGQSLTLYSYDLAEYKSVPDWLNSKYWANPEMFDKYWW